MSLPVRKTAFDLPAAPYAAPAAARHLRPVPAAGTAPRADMLPTPAAPDMPAAVGWLVLGCYAWILGAFWIVFGSGLSSGFMVAISTAYTAMYFAVPYVFLCLEPRHPGAGARPTLAEFLAQGVDTWTGRCGGAAALGQIISIPVALGLAASAIGAVIALAR